MKQTSDGLFQHPGLRSFLIKPRLPLFIGVLVLLALFARREWLLAGFIVSMLGEFIQIWCFASLDKNATLTIRGPYTMVRNPMYLGRFFIPLGFLMLLGQWWLLLAYAVIYWMYMDARVQREEAHLKPIFGAPYEAYCAQVRRFVPGWPQPGTTRGLLELDAVFAEQRRAQPAGHAGRLGADGRLDDLGPAGAARLNTMTDTPDPPRLPRPPERRPAQPAPRGGSGRARHRHPLQRQGARRCRGILHQRRLGARARRQGARPPRPAAADQAEGQGRAVLPLTAHATHGPHATHKTRLQETPDDQHPPEPAGRRMDHDRDRGPRPTMSAGC